MLTKKLTGLTLLSLLYWTTAFAQEEEKKKTYNTQRIEGEAPVIDGFLDDDAWNQVEWGGDFIGHQPDYKSTPSQDTKFKILYDEKFLYVGIRAFDTEPDKIVKRMSRRDGFDGDWVEMNIDSYNDKRTAFSFTASVSGVKGDEYVSNNGNNWDSTWDPIWYLKTSVDDEGWIAEYKIPLSQLRFANQDVHTWGIQFTRRFFREQERWTWQPVDPNAPGWVHLFGELNGITGIKPQKQLEIQPYVLGSTSKFPREDGNPYRDSGNESMANIGLDAKVGITSDITLDLTVNPDFGQVDADPSAVNLSAFQLFFREQRPFFLEGNNILTFGTSGGRNNLFYSRRIGARPRGYPEDGDVEYVDFPNNTRILGAAKLTGKNAKGFSWGFQDAVTAETWVNVMDTVGNERRERVEPLTNFTVARVQQDFDEGNTVVGGIFTNVKRFNQQGNGLEYLHDNAQSGGVDITQNLWDRKYSVNAKIGMSRVEGTEGALYRTQTAFRRSFQRTDNDYRDVDSTLTVLTGSFAALTFGKQSGKLNWTVGSNYRSPGLELNDIGFLQQTDNINNWVYARYQINDKTKLFRWQNYNIYHEQNYDFGGTRTSINANMNFNFQFHNFWGFETGFFTSGESISNADLRGGPSITYPGGTEVWFWVGTNQQKKIRVSYSNWFFQGKDDFNDSMGFNFNLTVRPTDAFTFTLSPSVSFRDNTLQYVGNDSEEDGIYLLSRIAQNTYSMSIRANYNVTPNLTIEFWGQPFLASGEYSEFKRVTESNATDLENRFLLIEDAQITYDPADDVFNVDENNDLTTDYSFGNPNFNSVEFRSNMVLRWEYIPGSTLFLVWANNGSYNDSSDRNEFRNLTGELNGLKGTNTFLIKLAHRFIR